MTREVKGYRLGRKQKRALMDGNGHNVALFSKSELKTAQLVCKLLNEHYKLTPTTEEFINFLDDNYQTKTFKPFKGAVDVCTKCLRGGCICDKPTRTHYITTEEIDERLYLNSYPKEK